jgi:hypothetical protein
MQVLSSDFVTTLGTGRVDSQREPHEPGCTVSLTLIVIRVGLVRAWARLALQVYVINASLTVATLIMYHPVTGDRATSGIERSIWAKTEFWPDLAIESLFRI